jgi:hypothetical protein
VEGSTQKKIILDIIFFFVFFQEQCELVEKHPTNHKQTKHTKFEDQALIISIIKGIGRK